MDGLFIGWDYFGHWDSSFGVSDKGTVDISLRVVGHRQSVEPGGSLETPKAFTGVYATDLDNMGNQILDWQYRYCGITPERDGFLPSVCWAIGGTEQAGNHFMGCGKPDYDSTFRKVFRIADLMRYVGADVYHRDWAGGIKLATGTSGLYDDREVFWQSMIWDSSSTLSYTLWREILR